MTTAVKLSGVLVLLLAVQCQSQKRLSLKEYLPTQLRLLETIAERLDSIDTALQKVQAAVEVSENETPEEPAVESRRDLDSENIQSRKGLPPVWMPPITDVPSAGDSVEKQQSQDISSPSRRGQNTIDNNMLSWAQRKRQLDYDQPWLNGTNPEDDQVTTD